ncbi:hypothetical protein C0995_009706 [Termitomyces sp. Mi166|nr:hypothetical protein C0995_009706 [Termitomyces sp. Mi166\
MSDALSASEFASTAGHLYAVLRHGYHNGRRSRTDMAAAVYTYDGIVDPAFHDPWSKSVCDRYVLFPEALKVVTSFTTGVLFILRLYAIYSRSLTVAVLGGIFLAAELGIKIWSFTDGTSLDLPEGLVGCILVGRTQLRFAFTWIVELVFDSYVFFSTVYRVFQHNRLRHGTEETLLDRIFRDGVLYFAVIFVANLVTVLLFMLAPPDIKAINASFSTLITNLMVSRLILNLRERSDEGVDLQPGLGASEVEWAPQDERGPDSPKTLFGLRQELHALQRRSSTC